MTPLYFPEPVSGALFYALSPLQIHTFFHLFTVHSSLF